MLACAFWLSGYVTGSTYFRTALRFQSKHAILFVSIFLVGAVPFAYLIYAVRWGISAPQQVNWQRPAMAVFGTPIVMGEWIDSGGLSGSEEGFKLRSMVSLSKTLGIVDELTPGIYSEETFAQLGDEEAGSNIFSALRPMIEDFSLLGALFIALIFTAAAAFSCKLLASGSVAGTPLLFSYSVWAIWSPLTSAFSYNAVLAACVGVSACIVLILRRR